MKRINITSFVLLAYLAVMAVIGWPGNNPERSYTEYAVIVAASVAVILLLRFVQIKRLRLRNEQKKDSERR